MDMIEKLEREIDLKKKIIEECKKTMQQVPKHLRDQQELVLEIHERVLEGLQQVLIQNVKKTKSEYYANNKYNKRQY